MYVTKKVLQAQATKAQLEALARRRFGERGYSGVSAEELVAEAGVTRGALYHHYDGKDGLFTAVVESVMREVHGKLAAAAAKERDALRALELGIHAFLSICTKPAIQRILLIDAPAVLGWTKWREMDARYGLGLLRAGIEGAIASGGLKRHDADLLAHVLLGALTEAAMLIARAKQPAKARAAAERAIASILAGWARDG